MSIKNIELERVKTHIHFNGNVGLGLIQRGEFSAEKETVNWKGKLPIKVHVVKCGKSSYELVEVDTKLASKIKYVKKGVYKTVGKENERVRFFKPADLPVAVVEISNVKLRAHNITFTKPKPITKKVTYSKLEKVTNASEPKDEERDKSVSSSDRDYSAITKILADFAEKIDKDFNLMSVCDVDTRKYAEDYVRREIKNQKFDIEGAVAEFNQFLDAEVK